MHLLTSIQQPFNGPVIQDNPGEPLPETIRSHYHHYPPQYL